MLTTSTSYNFKTPIMAGTFSQIYVQYVFSVKGRKNFLQKSWREDEFIYVAGIIKGKNQKSIIVNGVEDHVHVFVGLKPSMCISDLIRDVKNNDTNIINEQKFLDEPFSWQEGYGAFSYSHSKIDNVYKYIADQEAHHRKKTFKEEYIEFLRKFEIEYNEKYLFEWVWIALKLKKVMSPFQGLFAHLSDSIIILSSLWDWKDSIGFVLSSRVCMMATPLWFYLCHWFRVE